MYALPGEVVVKRRKPLLIPAVLLLAGVLMIVLNNIYGAAMSADLRSAVVFVGGVLAIGGLCALLARVFNSGGVPYHKGAKCRLRYEELYFEPGVRANVMANVAGGEVKKLLIMPRAQVPSVAVALYRTSDNRFAAMQAFEYADLEYKPLTELRIVAS